MKKALFVDFEDSFSFNVVQELTNIGLTVEVISWLDFAQVTDHDLLVLGPGPGHPDDYQNIFDLIKSWQTAGKKILGICLGHQILWKLLGHQVIKSLHPLHGQKIKLNLPKGWQEWLNLPAETWVQRYNSLAVMDQGEIEGIDKLVEKGEIIMSRSPQFISYQFHPESVGTKCRESFFRPIVQDLL
ncbi:MAG: aminodeoxychorismate/anthranilate synthase component II [Bdellovibrionales bacterium]|nr:aminodeoxychorismate/anthranilate synthase component II [Bdellovibrionales bacterium]